MAEVTINYKDAAIATMDASGTKTLQTQGKYCEDDIEVVYARPSGPSGTKQISITQNGTTIEDVAAYANAEITVNVQGGVGADTLGALLDNTLTSFSHSGAVTLTRDLFKGKTALTSISLPDVTSIPEGCFQDCANVSACNFDSCISLGAYALQAFGTNALNVLHLQSLKTTAAYSLAYLGSESNPLTVVLPQIETAGSDLFRMGGIQAADLGPNLAQLPPRTFYYTSGAKHYYNVILRRTLGVVTCANANAISSLDSHTTVWVPAALLSQYQSETNWSTKTSITWATIEGSIYENAYADGTPIT